MRVSFNLVVRPETYEERQALRAVHKCLRLHPVQWIIPGRREWVFDLDELKEQYPHFRSMHWFRGRAYIELEVEHKTRNLTDNQIYDTIVAYYITPVTLDVSQKSLKPPPEIQESLVRFREDHPYPDKVAFVMMRFGATSAHDDIVGAISDGLDRFGISAVRADEKEYHDHLFPNVLTYVYGCGFGIAVFERIEKQEFNPNVALEVGYMLALGKPVCLLKDRTLTALHTDLVGHLYKEFDPLHPQTKIPVALDRWLTDRGLVRKD